MQKVLVVNGVEDVQGRAVFVISALYHCSDSLSSRTIRFVDVRSGTVEIAAEVLAYDTGLNVEISSISPAKDPVNAFRDAAMYAAVVFNDTADLGLAQAAEAGVPSLVAVQFPGPSSLNAEFITRLASAHDPAIFAKTLRASLT